MKLIQSIGHGPVRGYRFGQSMRGTPALCSHVYLVDGLLIDTGHVRMRFDILNRLRKETINQAVITHHHEDHSGNVNQVINQLNIPVYASGECIDIMKSPPSISFAQWMTWGRYDPCNRIDLIGPTIETDQYRFDVIATPGHARDMIVLYEPEQGWLFSADLYVYHRIKYFMRAESMAGQIASIRKVLSLDFDYMFCGHNPNHRGGKKNLKKKLQFFEDFYGRAKELYLKGRSEKEIFSAMGLKEAWQTKLLSTGALSTMNMIRSVIRDEQSKNNASSNRVFGTVI